MERLQGRFTSVVHTITRRSMGRWATLAIHFMQVSRNLHISARFAASYECVLALRKQGYHAFLSSPISLSLLVLLAS